MRTGVSRPGSGDPSREMNASHSANIKQEVKSDGSLIPPQPSGDLLESDIKPDVKSAMLDNGEEDKKSLKIPKNEQVNTPSAADGKTVSAPSSSTSSPCGSGSVKDAPPHAPFSHPGMNSVDTNTLGAEGVTGMTTSSSLPDLSNDPLVPLSAMSALASGSSGVGENNSAGGVPPRMAGPPMQGMAAPPPPGCPPPGGMSPSIPPASPQQAQPLPSNVINKQPSTIDAPYMQQQSQIFVFSTMMANLAAEGVLKGQFVSIISFHCAQPGTKKVLEKYPLRVNQFNRPNPAEWLNQMTMKQGQQSPQQPPYRGPGPPGPPGVPGMQPNAPLLPPNHPAAMTRSRMTPPGPPQGMMEGGPMPGQGPPVMGPGGPQPRMMNMPPGQGGNPYGPGPPVSPCGPGGPPWGPNGPPMQPGYMEGPMMPGGPGQQFPTGNPPGCPPGGAMPQRLNHIPNVKVPDEVLTPQQRQHREEQLAALRKVTQMLQGPHQMDPNSPQNSPGPYGPVSQAGGPPGPMMQPQRGPPSGQRMPMEAGPPMGGQMQRFGPPIDNMMPGPGQGPGIRNSMPPHGSPFPWRPENAHMTSGPGPVMTPQTSMGEDFGAMYSQAGRGGPMGGGPPMSMAPGGPPNQRMPMGPGPGPMPEGPPGSGPPPRLPIQAQMEWQKLQQQYYEDKRRQHHSDPSSPLTPTSKVPGGPGGPIIRGQNPPEPNLMPVPSPQQIQYLHAFDGQELTIQKQPNSAIKEDNVNMTGSPMQPGKLEGSFNANHRGTTPDVQQPPPKYPGSNNPPTPKGPSTPQTPTSHPHPFELSPIPGPLAPSAKPHLTPPTSTMDPFGGPAGGPKNLNTSSANFDSGPPLPNDPISSMTHMTQQLTGGANNSSPGGMMGAPGPPQNMGGPIGPPQMMGHPGPPPPGPNWNNGQYQGNFQGPPTPMGVPPQGYAPPPMNVMGPGPGGMNSGYMNMQPMNHQGMPQGVPRGPGPGPPPTGPQGGGFPPNQGMMPVYQNQPPPPGGMYPPMGGGGPPMGIPPYSVQGKRMRMIPPSSQGGMPIQPDPSMYSGGANVQVRPNAPNTIQYLPSRLGGPPPSGPIRGPNPSL